MPYELAKELKDVGFPQGGPPSRFLWLETDNPNVMANGVYTPILEELIEACGELRSIYVVDYDQKSVCGDGAYGGFEATAKGSEDALWCWGSTPTEAVARLWLALNKKV